MPKVSVIVTVYNIEKYIGRCLESIFKQSFVDIEVIVIDDGSTDGSGDICDEYAKKDMRVTVLHKVNAGLVAARKDGVSLARGVYIYFVDGDDYIEKDRIQTLANAMDKYDADVVCAGFMYDYNNELIEKVNRQDVGIFCGKEINNIFTSLFPFMWNKMFKKEEIKEYVLCVDNRITISEDAVVVYPFLLNARKICVIDDVGYHYTQRIDSMMGSRQFYSSTAIELVLNHLKGIFYADEYTEMMETYSKLLYDIAFPERSGLCDNLDMGDRVIIYGAGNFGRALYNYISVRIGVEVIYWLDKNYMYMRSIGMPVSNPNELQLDKIKYDKLLIAISDNAIATAVENELKTMGAKKICRKL